MPSYGGENLIVNGNFDSSTGIGANDSNKQVKDGASIAPWKALRATNVGLVRAAKAENWRLTGTPKNECGTFVVYMQPASDAGDVNLYQDVTVSEPGLYKFSGKFIQCDHGFVKVFPNWTRGRTRNSGEATLERDFKPGEVVSLTMTGDCATTAVALSPISFDAPGHVYTGMIPPLDGGYRNVTYFL